MPRQAPTRAQFQRRRRFVEQIQSRGLATHRLGPGTQNRLQPHGQVLLPVGMDHHGHARGEFGLALPKRMLGAEQLAEDAGHGFREPLDRTGRMTPFRRGRSCGSEHHVSGRYSNARVNRGGPRGLVRSGGLGSATVAERPAGGFLKCCH